MRFQKVKKWNLLVLLTLLCACTDEKGVDTRRVTETIEVYLEVPDEAVYERGMRRFPLSLDLNPVPDEYELIGGVEFVDLILEVQEAYSSTAELLDFSIYQEQLGPRNVFYQETSNDALTPVIASLTNIDRQLANRSAIKLFDRDNPEDNIMTEERGIAMFDRIYPENGSVLVELRFDDRFDETLKFKLTYTIRFKEAL